MEVHVSITSTSFSECPLQIADIYLVLDSSSSDGDHNFQLMKDFVKQLIDALDVGFYKCRIGLMRYNSQQYAIFDMNEYYNGADMKTAVDGIPYNGWGTRTDLALNYVRTNDMFGTSRGGRDDITDILVVITDGASSMPVDTEAALMQQTGAIVFSFGIAGANINELNVIASDPDSEFVLYLSSFAVMASYVSNIVEVVCKHGEYMPYIQISYRYFLIEWQLGGKKNPVKSYT